MKINYKELIGFTSKEFLLAVVIVGILSVVAYPSYDAAKHKQSESPVAQKTHIK